MANLTLNEICEKLDELLIRQLELIQEYTDLSLNSELQQKDGFLNLAKARYIQGPNSLSQVQLPLEGSEEYSAVITVSKDEDLSWKRNTVVTPDENSRLMRQFGVLKSNNVKLAMKSFRQSVELHVDRINVAQQLFDNQQEFNALLEMKNNSKNSSEVEP